MPTTTKSRGNERSFGIYIHRLRRLESLGIASRPLQPQIIFIMPFSPRSFPFKGKEKTWRQVRIARPF
ncbi:MAG: hypothetical protein DMF00_09075 [Verrucomicrobia bacterium]|nr:MAG: hypothetical protein DMF00_09075 [Verrucomicrobiota bacterium]